MAKKEKYREEHVAKKFAFGSEKKKFIGEKKYPSKNPYDKNKSFVKAPAKSTFPDETFTPKEKLVTVKEGASREEIQHLLHEHRIEKVLVVDDDFFHANNSLR